MENYPKILSVEVFDDYKLLVHFANHIDKLYNCTPLLKETAFSLLRDKALFLSVQVDQGGYGIFWNDDIDLSESELRLHGKTIQNTEAPDKVVRHQSYTPICS